MGRVVKYVADGAGRVQYVQNGATGLNYAALQYNPIGGISSLAMQNGITETLTWNDRAQVTSVAAGSKLTMNFYPCGAMQTSCASGNNGNIQAQSIVQAGFNGTQNYSYDSASRLTQVAESGASSNWNESYSYGGTSGFVTGNRRIDLSNRNGLPGLTLETPVTANWFQSNNRVVGAPTDNLGNVLSVNAIGRSFAYDAESRMTKFCLGASPCGSAGTPNATYVYDGEGKRVQKTVNGATTTYVYDAAGQLAAEYASQGSSVVALCGTPTCYLTVDHLGSTRMVTDSAGNISRRYDYMPFGQEIFVGTGGRLASAGYQASDDGFEIKLTGQVRDSETGLDYFGARYFSGAQGRFTSPDPTLSSAQLGNPQSWNRYAYVYNNPLRHVDPDGQQAVDLANPNVQRLLQTLRAAPGRTAGAVKGGLIQTLAEYGIRRAFGEVFGYTPNAIQGDLSRNELSLLNKVSAYEKGALMLGVGQSNQAGIDAVDLDNVKGISLKSASNIERAKDQALDALKSATKAGFQDVEVFIDAPSVSKTDATGLTKIQNVLGTGTVTKVVVFTGQGAVEYRPTPEQQKQIACKKSSDSSCQ